MVKINSAAKLKGKEVKKMRPQMEQLVARAPAHRVAAKQGVPKTKMSLKDDAVVHYLAACVAPFSEEATGVRIPGPYEVRTRTTKLIVPYQFTGATVADAIFTANPMNSLYTSSAWTGGQSTATNSAGFTIHAAVDELTLANFYYHYRTVAYGIRIKCDSSYTATSGRMFVAVVPSATILPQNIGDTPNSAKVNYYNDLGAPSDSSGLVSASILSFPCSMEYSLSEVLAQGGVDISAPKTSPAHMNFLHLGGGTSLPDLATFNISTGVGTSYATVDRVFNGGQSNILVRFDGLTSASTITVEVVYHLEGPPVPSASAYIADSQGDNAVGHTSDVEKANIVQNAMPLISYKKPDIASANGLASLVRSAGSSAAQAGIKGAAKGILGLMA